MSVSGEALLPVEDTSHGLTVLDHQSSQLKGHLSYHIGNLSFLWVLNLQYNSFSHIIPEETGSLSKLVLILDLGKNIQYKSQLALESSFSSYVVYGTK